MGQKGLIAPYALYRAVEVCAVPPHRLEPIGIAVTAIVLFLHIALRAATRRGTDGPPSRSNGWIIWSIWLLGPATALALLYCLSLTRLLLPSVLSGCSDRTLFEAPAPTLREGTWSTHR
jgi:hypothetical protein